MAYFLWSRYLPQSPSKLINNMQIIRCGLIVMHPASSGELYATFLHQGPEGGPRGGPLLFPPAPEVCCLGEREPFRKKKRS